MSVNTYRVTQETVEHVYFTYISAQSWFHARMYSRGLLKFTERVQLKVSSYQIAVRHFCPPNSQYKIQNFIIRHKHYIKLVTIMSQRKFQHQKCKTAELRSLSSSRSVPGDAQIKSR